MSKNTKFLVWNINHQWNPQIINKLKDCEADIIALVEVLRAENSIKKVISDLKIIGYNYGTYSRIEYKRGVTQIYPNLIAYKNTNDNKTSGIIESIRKHDDIRLQMYWLEDNVSVNGKNISILCAHIPPQEVCPTCCVHRDSCPWRIDYTCGRFWGEIKEYIEQKKDSNTIILGDFNAFYKDDIDDDKKYCTDNQVDLCNKRKDCVHKPGKKLCHAHAKDMGILYANNWIDVWENVKGTKHKERFTYNTGDSERRLDYAFLSPSLKESLIKDNVEHLTAGVRPDLSNHSALVFELDLNKL